ncbi:hypothetical protein OG607_39565 [Streptomyces sp. NBC_01537]|uniref:hypothetical protein n=1 Tax=Streptomyces sp. NBC_01537 TaxID=2903896 RepID=UPI003862DE07
MTNEPPARRHWLPTYTWLPRTAEPWSDPYTGNPVTVPRAGAALLLIGGQAIFTSATPEWGIAASAAVILLALAAWPLRRRSVRPSDDGAWVDCGKSAIRLVRPVPDGSGPAVLTEVGAAQGVLLDPDASAAALRAAANLLAAAGVDPERLQRVGTDMPEADEEDSEDEGSEGDEDEEGDEGTDVWNGDCLVTHDATTAFVLELAAFGERGDKNFEHERKRQGALVARIAAALGAAAPVIPGPPGRIPDELQVTTDDLRAFAEAGLASAQRLERQFETSAVEGPADIALDLGRTRAWPSRVDAMPVRALATADPGRIAAILTEDLAAQAATDRAREQRGDAVGAPVADAWERRWHLYLERYAARASAAPEPAPEVADAAPVDLPQNGALGLTPTARAALLLAATADDSLRARAAGPFALAASPVSRRIPWPGHRRLAVAGDRLLLAITVYVVPFTHLWAGTVR